MSKVKQTSREHRGGLNYRYTFDCTCDDGTKHKLKDIDVGGPSEKKAEDAAKVECDETCGEA